MSDKEAKKQIARCAKWLQRFAELYLAVVENGNPASVVPPQSDDEPVGDGFLVLNGGTMAGCTPRGVLTTLHTSGLIQLEAADATPERRQHSEEVHEQVLFYGPTLPFVLGRRRLSSGASATLMNGVSTYSLPPGRSWYSGDCLVVRAPCTEAPSREAPSSHSGCGFLLVVPCRFEAVYAVFASRFQRHAVCVPTSGPAATPSAGSASDAEQARQLSCSYVPGVPGLCVVLDFVTEAEEKAILDRVQTHRDSLKLEFLSRRRAAHFNRRFIYGENKLGEVGENVNEEPDFYAWMRDRLNNTDKTAHIAGNYPVNPPGSLQCDQLTINYYDYDSEGQPPGIATHVDAHSPFESCIFLVSLGSYTVMDFCPWNAPAHTAPPIPVYLAPRSLVVMSGESRYGWTHGIAEKRTDILNEYTDVLTRHNRVSLTWRRGCDAPHVKAECRFPTLCDGS